MSRFAYELLRFPVSVPDVCCLRKRFLHPERIPPSGGAVLAVTHVSHLEPILVSLYTRRQVHWMSRIEFYKYGWSRALLGAVDAFPVNRQRPGASSLHAAIGHAKGGRLVGICPEGGVKTGSDSALRGGAIKGGAALIAQRAQVPIIPIAMAGTHALNRVGPWLPFRWGCIWMNVGEPILPPRPGADRRRARAATQDRLSEAYRALYRELLERTDLDDAHDR